MHAFHNDPAIKEKYLARVAAHRIADELIKGCGWESGKGCAIGCTLEKYDHALYPVELGIPEMLARLEDCIFEGLPNGDSQAWPERFLSVVTPGADLSLVGWKFLHWLITDSRIGDYDHKLVRAAVQQCAVVLEPLTRGEKVDTSAVSAANAAESAAESARMGAAWSAESAAESAANAARSAAWSAESAVRSVEKRARRSAVSAVRSAVSAANAAESATRSAAWQKMADKLITLIASC